MSQIFSGDERHVGGALRLLRERAELRQVEVARRAHIAPGMLSAYERGKQLPPLAVLFRILEALGVSLSDLEAAILALRWTNARKVEMTPPILEE